MMQAIHVCISRVYNLHRDIATSTLRAMYLLTAKLRNSISKGAAGPNLFLKIV